MSPFLKGLSWKFWLSAAFVVLLAASFASYHTGYSSGVAAENKRGTAALKAQKTEIEAHALLAQVTTEKNDESYQAGLATRDAALADAMREPSCVVIADHSAGLGKPYAAHQLDQPRGRNAVNSNTLYRFAGACETDRLKVIGLQQSIRDIYQALDQ